MLLRGTRYNLPRLPDNSDVPADHLPETDGRSTLERETRLELATSTLARLRSTN
jgi:hypothetical protein